MPFLGPKKPKIDFFHAPKKNGFEKTMHKKILGLKKSMHKNIFPKRPHGNKTLGSVTLLDFFGAMKKRWDHFLYLRLCSVTPMNQRIFGPSKPSSWKSKPSSYSNLPFFQAHGCCSFPCLFPRIFPCWGICPFSRLCPFAGLCGKG